MAGYKGLAVMGTGLMESTRGLLEKMNMAIGDNDSNGANEVK